MLKMSSQLETVVNAYKTLAKIPSVLGGRISNNGNKVTAKWSVRNLDKGRTTKYVHDYMLDISKDDVTVIADSDFGMDVSNEILSSVSPSEAFRALVREDKEGKEKKHFLEVWSKSTMVHSIDLNALEMHGDVYSDTEFGGLEWSPDETALVYVAEKKWKKSEPYIKRKAEDKSNGRANDINVPKRGEEFIYRQDWGEQLVGRQISVIVVCRLPDETLTVLPGLPESWCPGQVRFTPENDGVVGVAYDTEPTPLGLMFCTNRPGYIFQLNLDGTLMKISREGMSVRSPRFSSGGCSRRLVWLQRKADGPHHACQELVAMDWNTRTQKTVIPIVQREQIIENGEYFYGLYCQSLPSACFSADGERLLISSPQRNEMRSYVLDLRSQSLTDISNKSQPGSTLILDVKSDVILAVCSNTTTPTQLHVAKVPAPGEKINWARISSPADIPKVLASSKFEYLYLEHKGSREPIKSFTALYLSPAVREGQKFPLVVWPHGGPHASFINAYSLEASLYNMLGFACVRVNFRGSIGCGDSSARCLIGNVGEYDVADCYLALTTVKEKDGCETFCLYGGSFGGFTSVHLAARYPDLFSAMVLRNPVIDLATKGEYADNRDGCAVEAGYEYSERGPSSEEQLLAMRRCSPLAYAHLVRAPTALMLGSGDCRVPCFQGLQYSRRLIANGVSTKVYMYDDNHTLSSLPAEMDNLINGAYWLLSHIRQ